MPLRVANASFRIVVVLCLGYVLSQFLRHSVGVITPELSRDVGVSPQGLGVLGAAYFIAFALAQIPVGIALDSVGARRTMVALLCISALGSVVFALSPSAAGLIAARAMLGLGTAALLMGSFAVFAYWFPPDRFATMASVVMGVGYMGSVLATAPLGYAVDIIGWRSVFWIVTAYTVFLILVYSLVIRDAPAGHAYHTRRPVSLRQAIAGLKPVIKNPQLPRVWLMQLVAYGTMASVLGLWAGHYFAHVHGLEVAERGEHLLVMAVCATLGMFAFGPLDRIFNTRKWLVVGGASANFIILSVFALVPGLTLTAATVLLGLLAAFNGYSAVLMAHCRAIFPIELVGRGITLTNTGNMGGVALMQYAGGAILGALGGGAAVVPEFAFRVMFGFLAASLLLAILIYAGARDRKPFEDSADSVQKTAAADPS